jgi:hypothetical protein
MYHLVTLYESVTQPGLYFISRYPGSASICLDIGGSAGVYQHATEQLYPLPHPTVHVFLLFALLHHRPVHLIFSMSQAPSTSASTSGSASSSNFQSIFNAALKAYEKKTKKDLLAHPLAAQLKACDSPNDILAVLQEKVNELDQSRSADERLSQWLNPTINVLYSFSATIGAGVGLVSTVKSTCLHLPLIANFVGILARISHLLWYWGTPLGEHRL